MSKRLKTSLVITFLVLSLATIFFYFIFHFNIDTNGYAGEDHGEVIHDQDIDLVDIYLDKASQLIYSYPDSSRFYSEKGLGLASGKNASASIHNLHTIIGISYIAQSQYKNALDAFFNSLELAVSEGNKMRMVYAYNNIGAVYIKTAQYRDALEAFFKAKELLSSTQDRATFYSLKTNIGSIYDAVGEKEKAKDNYFSAYEGFLALNDLNNLASVSSNIASFYSKVGITDSAYYFFSDAASLANEQNNMFLLKNIQRNKGHFLLSQGDYKGAVALYHASDSLSKMLNVRPERSLPIIGLSKAYLKLKDFDRAMHYADEAHAIADYYDNNDLLSQVYEVYADIYKKRGDYERAFHYYYEAKELQATLLSQTEAYGVFQVELEHLNRQIEMRDFEMERKQLVISKTRNTFIFIIIILVLLFISLALAYFYNLARIRQAEKERQYQYEIKHSYEINRATLEAENSERKRLGMELHDGLGPLISLTKLNISNVLEGDVICQDRKNELLEKSSDYLDEILKEMRTVSNNLAPLILMEKGLEYALHDMLSKVNSVDNYSVHVNISGMNGSLGNLLELAIYRTIQEIINNIVKHAQADEIVIDMVKGEESITVMIEDNGKGFIVDEVGSGIGLLSAKSRIESLKGNLLIDSKPGRGTIVSIILPLSTHSVGETSHT